jgi:phage shock protein A
MFRIKQSILSIAMALPLGFLSTQAYSAKTELPPGQPFQILQSQIDTANATIAVIKGQVNQLADQVAGINTQLGDIQTGLTNLESLYFVQTGLLNDIRSRLRALEGADLVTGTEIVALKAELAELRSRHIADMHVLEREIVQQQTDIDGLRSQINTALAQLNNQIALLRAAVVGNSADISSLLAQSAIITANIVSMLNTLANHEARLSGLESGLASISAQISTLAARVDNLELVATKLDTRVSTLESYHSTGFSGIQTNLPLASLSGWSVCHTETYATNGKSLSQLQSQCNKAKLMLACRPTGSSTLTVAAYADRADVLFDVGTASTATHQGNGVNWYYNSSWSWGFAPIGESVMRNSCDVATTNADKRLCLHTGGGTLNGGWRCGVSTGLNASAAYERLFLHAD